jgi:indolepyruvate ferredoxin oxidoreductase
MDLRDVRLSDRYDLDRSPVLLSGTQALVRATLMQRARDAAVGLNTAGYVTGYRGSPLGAVDGVFHAAGQYLSEAQVKFHPGLNEDLAATALWGAQQAELRGEGKHQGVFGLWYGKGPGIDRTGDVFRHANFAGSSKHGGVLVAMGDDHTCESSTTCHQSEMALMDAMMPILSPAGVQELIDYMLTGWAMSRYSGLWVGIKSMKDTIEATAVVDGDPHRLKLVGPTDFVLPPDGLNIRLNDTPQLQEARLHDHKRFAAQAFARANKLDHRVHGAPGARIGIVSSGKAWLDTMHALELLGIDDAVARQIRDRGKAPGHRDPAQGSAVRNAGPCAGGGLEGRGGQGSVFGQAGPQPGRYRPEPGPRAGRRGHRARADGQGPGAAGSACRGWKCARTGRAPALVLCRLPA